LKAAVAKGRSRKKTRARVAPRQKAGSSCIRALILLKDSVIINGG